MVEIKADLSSCSSTKTNDKSVCMYFMKQPQFYDKKWKMFIYLGIIILQITKYKCILLEISEALLSTCLIVLLVVSWQSLLKHFLQYQWIFRMTFGENVLLSQSAWCQIVITYLLHLKSYYAGRSCSGLVWLHFKFFLESVKSRYSTSLGQKQAVSVIM